MKVIIAGSRTIDNFHAVEIAVIKSKFDITEVVSGRAKGVDYLGELYALKFSIPIKKFPAQWTMFGKRAGYIRNAEMSEYADALIAVWDGHSPGTLHMINLMKELNKPVYVHKVLKET